MQTVVINLPRPSDAEAPNPNGGSESRGGGGGLVPCGVDIDNPQGLDIV